MTIEAAGEVWPAGISEAGHAVVAPAEAAIPHAIADGRRLAGLDVLRLAAVVGLVWYHFNGDDAGSLIGYAGLPAVLSISVALPVIHVGRRSLLEDVARRGQRLLLPWAVWSAFYGLRPLLKQALHLQPWQVPFHWESLLIGPAIHLWYLPYAMVATLLALILQRVMVTIPVRYLCPVGAFLGGASLAGCSLASRAWEPGEPFTQWLYGLAAIPFGLAIGTACRARDSRVRVVLGGITASCLVTCAVVLATGDRATALSYGLGIPMVCLAVIWPLELGRLGQVLVSLSMGIYVLHPFVFENFLRFGLGCSGIMTVGIVLATGLLTFALRQTPVRRFL